MHVTSYRRLINPPQRGRVAAVLLLWLAGMASAAQAVEFDEKLKAPRAMGGAEIKSTAQSYSASFARVREASPVDLVANKALFFEHFDLEWQINRALEDKRPLEDLLALGFVKHEGGLRIDYGAFPQWQPFPELLASLVPTWSLDNVGPLLVNRGFRASDVAALKNYVDTHDLKAATSARTLPLAISFSKVVKKYDRLKRPVGKDVVFSFLYQRGKAEAEARRAWSEGLIHTLDDQRVRILHSYFAEMPGIGYWAASDVDAGVANLLAVMRLPDYEQRATAEARGVSP
jgi:hypothetical protein